MLPQVKEVTVEQLSLDSTTAIVSAFGPNLMVALTSMTPSEVRRFLGYQLSDVIAKNAEGEIPEIYRKVQRPLQRERAARFGDYIERTILDPRSLDHPDQGYLPAITIIADRPLKIMALPGGVSGGLAQAIISRGADTKAVISDGVGRFGGIEYEEKKLSRGIAGPREMKLRHALETLRIPVTILFPKHGVLGEEHMAQALFDQNVLATALPAGTAMARDMRSSYNAIMRKMQASGLGRFGISETSNYPKNGVPKDVFVMTRMLRFVRVAVEGRKAAESAKGVTASILDAKDVALLAEKFASFWLRIINTANADSSGKTGRRFTPADAKFNMALTMAGMAALGVIANELFRVRHSMSDDERNAFIDKVAAIPWERTNPIWSGLLTEKFDAKTGKSKGLILDTAGGSAIRAVTKILQAHAFGEADAAIDATES